MPMVNDKERWDKSVIARQGSFLQSWEWGELHENLGRKVLRFTVDELCGSIIVCRLPLNQSYLYMPRGPVGTK